MILQALTRYYEILAADGRLPKPGYSSAKVSFALNLSASGELLEIFPLKKEEQRGKKTVEVPQEQTVPEQVIRAVNILPNFLCDNSSYFLGLDKKGKPERSLNCLAASRELHETVLKDVHCPAAKAVLGFFRSWNPSQAETNAAFQAHREQILAGGYLVFQLDSGIFVQDDPEIRNAWDNYRASLDNGIRMPCLVTGKEEPPVAILHAKIKGVAGAQTAGANLVSFNSDAYESYGHVKAQGLNAPVGKYAAFAYGTALNHLLADREHRLSVGDTTVVYWAESSKPIYQNIFTAVLSPENEDGNKLLDNIMKRLAEGKPVADDVEMKTTFYVLGLAPNAARISVRFFLRDSFANFLTHIRKHYDDLAIAHAPQDFPYLTPYWLLRETVNPNSNSKASSPLLSGEVLRSILLNLPYPQSLQSAVLLRIRAEQDDPDRHIQKITRGRAAILKACLLRMQDNDDYKEVLTVSLNESSNNRAYVLGRLFAAFEKAQKDANPGINSTIKDRFFTSACATPGNVFPTLFKLYENHIEKIRKMEGGKPIYIFDEKLIGGLMDKLNVDENPFPAHLFLNDQSIFVLGYYHQVQNFFTPKEKKHNAEEE